MQARISFRRGAEHAYGRGFHFGVAPSSHTDADSTWAWRRAGIGGGFHFGVAPSLHPDAGFTSAWRRAGIRTRIPLRRFAELKSEREFNLCVAPN